MSTYYTCVTGEEFRTTAVYPNRVTEKETLERDTDLVEGGSPAMHFFTSRGTLVAKGYIRVVYGDHGAYLEFLQSQLVWEGWERERAGVGYYDKWYAKDGSRLMLYDQRRTVEGLPNPPAGPRSFKGDRKEGYADYRVGRYYLSPYDVTMRKVTIER